MRTMLDGFDRGARAVFKSACGCLETSVLFLALPGPHLPLSLRERGNRLRLAQEFTTIPSFKTEETTVGHDFGDYLHQHGYEVLLQATEVASANTLLRSDGSHVGKRCFDP
jgi:hypothetical protein